jgi:hypothetical protein
LITSLGECQEQSDGKNTLLVFNRGLQRLLKEELETCDFEYEARSTVTVKVIKAIRRDIFEWDEFES